MIPSLPETSGFPGPAVPRALPAMSGAGGATGMPTGVDFAGLLGAVQPAATAIVPDTGNPGAAPLPEPASPLAALAAEGNAPQHPAPARLSLARFVPPPAPHTAAAHLGRIVPGHGAELPPPGDVLPQEPISPGSGEVEQGEELPTAGSALPVEPPPVIAMPTVPVPLPAALTAPVALRTIAAPAGRGAAPLGVADAADLPQVAPAAPTPLASSAAPSLLPSAPETATPITPTAADPAATTPALPEPPASAVASPAPAASPAIPAERGETRGSGPQLDSTIAQVGEIREALRAARPELTVRHAEFGLVSLRLEAPAVTAAVQDWRAVLSSRDPGFVQAFHAALAERVVAPGAESAPTGNGAGNGASQGGGSPPFAGSDQRYGFSQGSGQGLSQPYPDHSGQQGGDASPNPRNQHRRAEEAASAATQDAAPDARRDGGLFA